MAEKRNTLQKEIIYDTLYRMHNHPTAAMVYEEVHKTHPTISRSTGHVRCRLCGAVADIPAVAISDPEDTAGFVLEEYAVEYRGLCPHCRIAAP